METFYLLHFSDGDFETVIITQEVVTPELIEEQRPFGMGFNRAIECQTSGEIGLLPLESELRKH